MCGVSIAKVGTPGGPIEHTQLGVGLSPDTSSPSMGSVNAEQQPPYYPGGGNTMSVQLEAIGIRSTKKTWATIAGIAALLFVLGGVATFFTMKSTQHEVGGAAEEDPFELGTPEIQNPEGVDFVSGRREGAQPTPPTPSGTEVTPTPSTTMDAVAANTPTSPSTPSTMSQTSTSPATMESTTMETSMTEPVAPTTMEPEPTTMDTVPADPGEAPPETEMEVEMYTSRVRYLIRRYYLPRSQSCFEHATRNNPSLHGQVTVSLTIGASGNVTSSSVARNSTGDTQLGSCLATQVRSWQLTPPPGGEPVTMTLPFSR